MTKYLRSFLFIALFCSLSGPALDTATDRVSAARSLHPEVTSDRFRIQTIEFKSALMGKTLFYKVVLPVGYYPSIFGPNTRMSHYPVLYLLHGWGEHYWQWTTITKLFDYAAQYRMIIVTPEGNGGFYTDSATIPKEKYESYILDDLIPDVERRFHALKTRKGRSIAGLSMGGYGALKFGVKHPDKFVFVGSMSGAVSAAWWKDADFCAKDQLNCPWKQLAEDVMAAFGSLGSPTRAANDLYKLYGELPKERIATLPYVYLDCGKEDMLLQSNRSLANILLARKIPYEYHEPPGNHTAAYWDRQVQDVLRIADQKMNGL